MSRKQWLRDDQDVSLASYDGSFRYGGKLFRRQDTVRKRVWG